MTKVNLLAKTTSIDGSKNVERIALIAAQIYDYDNKKLSSIIKMNNKELALTLEELKEHRRTLYDYILKYVTFVFGIEEMNSDCINQIYNVDSLYSDQVNCIFRGRSLILSANAKDLLSFFKEVCCSSNCVELNEIADKMLDICLQEAPNLFRNAGAPCTFGKCDKENLSCNRKKNAKVKQIIRTY